MLIDFIDSPKLYDFTPRLIDANERSYRRGDRELVTNDSPTFKAELAFEFQRLTQADVDTLEGIYRDREHFICIPDTVDEPEKVYVVRWASGFERRDTMITNWNDGKSLSVIFREI